MPRYLSVIQLRSNQLMCDSTGKYHDKNQRIGLFFIRLHWLFASDFEPIYLRISLCEFNSKVGYIQGYCEENRYRWIELF